MSMNQPPFVPQQRSKNLQTTRSFIPGCSPSDSAPRDSQKTCPPVPPRVGSLIRLQIEPIFRPVLHPCRQCNSIRDGSCQLLTSRQEHSSPARQKKGSGDACTQPQWPCARFG